MKQLFLAIALFGGIAFAEESSPETYDFLNLDQPGYLCATQCPTGSCARWCSTQQRCQTYCSPTGEAACYCFL